MITADREAGPLLRRETAAARGSRGCAAGSAGNSVEPGAAGGIGLLARLQRDVPGGAWRLWGASGACHLGDACSGLVLALGAIALRGGRIARAGRRRHAEGGNRWRCAGTARVAGAGRGGRRSRSACPPGGWIARRSPSILLPRSPPRWIRGPARMEVARRHRLGGLGRRRLRAAGIAAFGAARLDAEGESCWRAPSASVGLRPPSCCAAGRAPLPGAAWAARDAAAGRGGATSHSGFGRLAARAPARRRASPPSPARRSARRSPPSTAWRSPGGRCWCGTSSSVATGSWTTSRSPPRGLRWQDGG